MDQSTIATKTLQQRMEKRVEKKEDGRLLIYYTFASQQPEQQKSPPTKAESK